MLSSFVSDNKSSYHVMMSLFPVVVKQGTCNFIADPFPAIAGGISLHFLQGREDGVIVSHIYVPQCKKSKVLRMIFLCFYRAVFLYKDKTIIFLINFFTLKVNSTII